MPKNPPPIVESNQVDRACRDAQIKALPAFFTPIQACLGWRTVATKNPKVQISGLVIIMPPNDGSDRWQRLLRHEYGHVNCGAWH